MINRSGSVSILDCMMIDGLISETQISGEWHSVSTMKWPFYSWDYKNWFSW
jgi:hypothetical protein